MKPLLFATNNISKIKEMRLALNGFWEIKGLQEAGIFKNIPEPYPTLEENALAKSSTIYELTRLDCFSEDSGLEVESLNGAPGVHSARFAGPQAIDSENIALLLERMKNKVNRKARFRTVISLIYQRSNVFFEGVCEGSIALEPAGQNGFGYDPVFIPEGFSTTFAEMDGEAKNQISHRRMAADKLVSFLQTEVLKSTS